MRSLTAIFRAPPRARRRASLTQSQLQRAIRAAKKESATLELKPDGTIFIHPSKQVAESVHGALESGEEIVL